LAIILYLASKFCRKKSRIRIIEATPIKMMLITYWRGFAAVGILKRDYSCPDSKPTTKRALQGAVLRERIMNIYPHGVKNYMKK